MSQPLQTGAVFGGRYRIVRCIAQGGMGSVYEVIHLETERRRALKVMHPHILQSDEMRARFQREARVGAQVESDFIVEVFDAGIDRESRTPFLVMELLRGEDLIQRVRRLGRLPAIEVVTFLHQTARALDKTHRASIVHRDLKPENLFLTLQEDGAPRIKVLDFGIAKIVAEGATTGASTQSIGTPLYMSPEQFTNGAKISGASDLYSLAMVAYTLLVGAPYWGEEGRGGNVFAIAVAAMAGVKEAPSLRAARHGVALPPAFDAWFARVTAFEPAQRLAPATLAILDLAHALGVEIPTGPFAMTSSPSFVAPTSRGSITSNPFAAASNPALPHPPPVAMTPHASPGTTTLSASLPGSASASGRAGRAWIALVVASLSLGAIVLALVRELTAGPTASPGEPAAPVASSTASTASATPTVADTALAASPTALGAPPPALSAAAPPTVVPSVEPGPSAAAQTARVVAKPAAPAAPAPRPRKYTQD